MSSSLYLYSLSCGHSQPWVPSYPSPRRLRQTLFHSRFLPSCKLLLAVSIITGHSSNYRPGCRSWIFFSNLTIVFNKWLFDTNFSKLAPTMISLRRPLMKPIRISCVSSIPSFIYDRSHTDTRSAVILTCWHLFFATIATQIMARTTNLLDSRKTIGMTSEIYCRKVIPIAVLFSGSLVCGNLSYLHLTVAFIQMLKASAPAIALVVSLAWKLKEPSWGAFFNIAIISIGVILASIGELRWDLTGVILQMSSTVFEVLRLIMTEVLLKSENDELGKMDTLLTLYYYAPACVVVNTVVAFLTEGPLFRMDDIWATGIDVLIINAGVAFMLNISSVFLVCPSYTSAQGKTLT